MKQGLYLRFRMLRYSCKQFSEKLKKRHMKHIKLPAEYTAGGICFYILLCPDCHPAFRKQI